jgi:hypothetical protein
MAKLGRDGRVQKHTQRDDYKIPPHDGMRFKTSVDGQSFVAVGVSRTKAAVLDGGLPVSELTEGKVAKRFYEDGQSPTHPSQAIRRPNTAQRGDAGAVLRDAMALGKAALEPTQPKRADKAAKPREIGPDRSAPGAVKSRRV